MEDRLWALKVFLFSCWWVWLRVGSRVQLVRGGGFGLVGDLIVGVIGALIAGYLFPRLGISLGSGILGAIIAATIGAVILLFILRAVKRA